MSALVGIVAIIIVALFLLSPKHAVKKSLSKPSPTSPVTVTPSPTPETHKETQNYNSQQPSSTQPPKNNQTPSNSTFVYPNSTQVSPNVYESSDDPTTITDWYKNKINSMGMNSRSFVTTNTNGNILNKLVASGGNSTISVEISRQSGGGVTRITLNY